MSAGDHDLSGAALRKIALSLFVSGVVLMI